MEEHHLTITATDLGGVTHVIEGTIDVLVTVHGPEVNAQPPPPCMRIGPDGTITSGPIHPEHHHRMQIEPKRRQLPPPGPSETPGPPCPTPTIDLFNALFKNYLNSVKYVLTLLT